MLVQYKESTNMNPGKQLTLLLNRVLGAVEAIGALAVAAVVHGSLSDGHAGYGQCLTARAEDDEALPTTGAAHLQYAARTHGACRRRRAIAAYSAQLAGVLRHRRSWKKKSYLRKNCYISFLRLEAIRNASFSSYSKQGFVSIKWHNKN